MLLKFNMFNDLPIFNAACPKTSQMIKQLQTLFIMVHPLLLGNPISYNLINCHTLTD